MKVAVVVQRYGSEIGGGAELHARYIAERLAPHVDVRVLTTCARDYITWSNELPAGEQRVNGIAVERFPVASPRDVRAFARHSARVFDQPHTIADELAWLQSEGPVCPALIARLQRNVDEFDFVLAFSVRYYHAYHAARALPAKTILVPTAEREPSLGLAIFAPIFRGVRAIMYNSFEERALIQGVADNQAVPGTIVGVGSEIPASPDGARARGKFGLPHPFVIYIGRIDANKGCAELFSFFARYVEATERLVDLVLVGTPVLPIPQHPRIRHLGFVSDADKFDLLAAADVLVMPSFYESLSMVALEAWALGRPVLANARCDVLLGQCLRSNGGLFYENAREFAAALDVLLGDAALAATLGRNGQAYYDVHYSWPVIVRKYLEMFSTLERTPPAAAMEPLPGFLARRRMRVPAGADRLRAAPTGPVTQREGALPVSS